MPHTPSAANSLENPEEVHDLRMISADDSADKYIIPLQYRKMENLHIVFWLFKDVAWCMGWKWLGMVMIIPTLAISVMIAYRTRKFMSELTHNLAITVWISANSYWMISEFLHFDTILIAGSVTYKHLALIPFVTGILILAFYYLIWRPEHRSEM